MNERWKLSKLGDHGRLALVPVPEAFKMDDSVSVAGLSVAASLISSEDAARTQQLLLQPLGPQDVSHRPGTSSMLSGAAPRGCCGWMPPRKVTGLCSL